MIFLFRVHIVFWRTQGGKGEHKGGDREGVDPIPRGFRVGYNTPLPLAQPLTIPLATNQTISNPKQLKHSNKAKLRLREYKQFFKEYFLIIKTHFSLPKTIFSICVEENKIILPSPPPKLSDSNKFFRILRDAERICVWVFKA